MGLGLKRLNCFYSPEFFPFFLAALAAFFSFGVLDAAVLPVLGLPSFSLDMSVMNYTSKLKLSRERERIQFALSLT